MNSFRTRMKWTGLALLTGAIFSVPATAGGRPATSDYTPQQLEAMSAGWAAKGALLGNPDAASFYTREQLQAMSASWAAKGRLLGQDAASFYTPQQLQALSASWAAKGALLGTSQPVTGDGFHWGDFGIGAAAMLGLVLLVGGLVAAAHYSRRGGIRAQPLS